jgi:hypothetical protein
MPEQIVIVGAGVPGAVNSYYSAAQTLVTPGDASSPPVAEYTLVPDIGFILFEDLEATLSVVIRTDDSPATYVTLIAAGAQGQVWSDGANIFVKNSAAPASPEISAKYFVLAQKP